MTTIFNEVHGFNLKLPFNRNYTAASNIEPWHALWRSQATARQMAAFSAPVPRCNPYLWNSCHLSAD